MAIHDFLVDMNHQRYKLSIEGEHWEIEKELCLYSPEVIYLRTRELNSRRHTGRRKIRSGIIRNCEWQDDKVNTYGSFMLELVDQRHSQQIEEQENEL
ncbi:hypothetical protein [Acetonema longum]|uniref:Uncharacterized protein n=1 Tax=Acetonema longum DSM 6540 TaxID=1009370 RepID=F7NE97_9FIRM|nr:hypothetical protein [Acetonema longum]EGO65609.1 hypothetical protein ALO_01799 [Acetonema longum DSM 6540]